MRPDFTPFDEESLGKPYDLRLIKRLLPFIKPYNRLLFGSVVLVILITLFNLFMPYVTKTAIDRYIVPQPNTTDKIRYIRADITDSQISAIISKYPDKFIIRGKDALIRFDNLSMLEKNDIALLRKKDISGVMLIALAFVFIIIFDFILNYLQAVIMEYAGQKMMHDLRMKLFSHIQSLSMAFFTKNPVGRLVTRVTSDVQNMHEMFTSVIAFIFKDLFVLVGITIALLLLQWKLALITFSLIPLILYAAFYFSRKVRDAFRMLRVKIAEINIKFSESVEGIKVIQLFSQENNNYQQFETLNHDYYLAAIRHINIYAGFMRFMAFLSIFAVALIIWYGGSRVISETLTLGALVAFLSYTRMFFAPIQDIAQKYNIMQNAMASAERIFLILDSAEKLPKPQDSSLILQHIDEISFENVYFGYTSEQVLKDISFTLKAGKILAIVGPTGSGKTSLIQLLIRFYAPNNGKIQINKTDIRDINISALRSKMALVTQEPFLFSGTVRENIFWDRNVSESEIEKILNASNCKFLIDRLPEGINTVLSKGGGALSSGERQLIAIARAFARNPELIILDEATSYIDSQTEVKIQSALSNLMQNRTTIVVAHRLSTARQADHIIVLYWGKIIESGSHNELMAKKGFYYRLNMLDE